MTTRKLYLAHVLANAAKRIDHKLGWETVPPKDMLLGWVETELRRRGIGLETAPLPAVQTKLWYLPAQDPFHPNTYSGSSVTVYRKVPGVTVPADRFIQPTEYTDTVIIKIFDNYPPSLIYSPSNQLKDQVILKAVRDRFAGALVSNALSPRWAHTRSAPAPLLLPQTDASDWPPPLPPGVDRYNRDRLNAAWKALPKHPEVAALQTAYLALPPGKYGGPTLSNWNMNYSFLCRKLQDNPTRAEAQNWLNTVLLPGLREMLPAKPVEAPAPAANTAWEAELTRLQEQARELDRTRSTIHGRLKAWDRVGGPDRSHKKSMTEYRALEQQLQSATQQYQAAQAALKAHKAKRPT